MKDYINSKERLGKNNDLINFIKNDIILFSMAVVLYIIFAIQFLGEV